MPTFEATARFEKDYQGLDSAQRERFRRVVLDEFVPDLAAGRFRAGLRVRRVEKATGIFEMTWAPDGRATWQYGKEMVPGQPHVIWRRVGAHGIFRSP